MVSDAAQALSKTSAALKLLAKVGASEDADKSKASKNLHKGKGKMRNRRYTQRRGPLVIYDADEGLVHAFRNIPGVELAQVERLNLLQLAPGGHLGRFCVWTKSAFAKLDAVFGTQSTASAQKGGFKVPRALMANPDLNRVINSDEIQARPRGGEVSWCRQSAVVGCNESVAHARPPCLCPPPQSIVNAPKDHHARAPLKKNPLRNLGAMLKLNPYAKARLGLGLGTPKWGVWGFGV